MDAANTINEANTAWVLTSTALVLFMTLPGLALFYGGLVRSKNVLSVMAQCFGIACAVSVLWMLCGYSLAFGTSESMNALIGGFDKAMFSGIREGVSANIPESVFAMFQMTFAIITPALVIGGFAERMKFISVMVFSCLWLMLVYVPVCHWVWGGGWLFQLGLLDFAGGTVVHITAGTAALVCALVLGPRRGFPTTAMPPHNLTMTVTGAGMLWVGWYGFNAGSALAANGDAGMAMLCTHMAAATGALTWMALEWIKFGKPSVLGAVTGMVAGLGTITPASGFVGAGSALFIGIAAGATCFYCTMLVKRVLKIDDSLDVSPVHGVGGILGTLMAGLFASKGLGIFSGKGLAEGVTITHQLGVQALGIVTILVYTAILTFVLLKLTSVITGGLRITPEEEHEGLDIVDHDERGYVL